MEPEVRQALDHDRTIAITTTGRRSGKPHRTEHWLQRIDHRYYLSGTPGRRDWYANLVAQPVVTLHLQSSAVADLPSTARPVTADNERRAVLSEIAGRLDADAGPMIAQSPLVEISVDDLAIN